MTDREKLFDLMMRDPCPYSVHCSAACKYYKSQHCHAERYADHLIANGVTVQTWISVKDRLPEPFAKEPEWSETVLFRTITGRIYSGYRNQGRPQTSFCDDDWTPPYWLDESERIEVEDEYVTHWMPLPEPPKGE